MDDPDLLGQLRRLEEQKTPSGIIDIRPANGKDDIAVAVALAAFKLSQFPEAPLTISLGIVDLDVRPFLGMIPSSCQYAAVYGNYPQCMDDGHCLVFNDQRAQMFGLEMNAGIKISNSVDNGRTLNRRFSRV